MNKDGKQSFIDIIFFISDYFYGRLLAQAELKVHVQQILLLSERAVMHLSESLCNKRGTG